MANAADDYLAVSSAAGWTDRPGRARLEIDGPDRAKFLHNLTTNDIKRRAPGQGCEAFVTSPQGKTLGYLSVLVLDDRLLVRTDRAALEFLDPHFQKYGTFDDVSMRNVSDDTFEIHVAGPQAEAWLANHGAPQTPADDLAHVAARVGGRDVRVIRESPTGRPGLTLIGSAADADDVVTLLSNQHGGLVRIEPATFDALRIEAGTPVFGRDVTPDNLPQELGRDDRAISFVKGCYLGQETVARIDALGHVNRLLKGLLLDAEAPGDGDGVLEDAGKAVGRLTSVAFSPGWRRHVALGYVKLGAAQDGRELELVHEGRRARAIVKDLPMMPDA